MSRAVMMLPDPRGELEIDIRASSFFMVRSRIMLTPRYKVTVRKVRTLRVSTCSEAREGGVEHNTNRRPESLLVLYLFFVPSYSFLAFNPSPFIGIYQLNVQPMLSKNECNIFVLECLSGLRGC